MKYILSEEDDVIQFGKYLDALAKYRDQLPDEVAQFAEDESRFCLQGGGTLHDAWIETITVREKRAAGDDASSCEIELVLLGPLHDRRIQLRYLGVKAYTVDGRGENGFQAFHGDIHTHEVRLSDDGLVVHEIVGVDEFRIQVECRTFTVMDEMLGDDLLQ
ncbi:hypothetical protein Rhal01_03465 [Rubritalea halochordaticola]|uniref:Uncharacterized protein n=1 Tax=Rubritalea halochordaticola TaxID=714537 RepID=A0ABP9V9H7_9BACT